ncbi:hypothetical protein C922_01410 [Plasmodium inui San Antonio 1]|uniref:Uncharacterized protein n=1 Tax=Plasmodium inui San Antonio 1 TaxID=1237626 RepID=W7A9M5_9APIC|nr:hypothetical protein C922_01410 [Plasmodium inui San Antonio 1]EUD68390.1 hypothetical protein C922_01410 [Plasmodium inui San Antonio 1]
MPRPIYVLLIDCFLGLSVTYTCLFEHVRGHKKTVTFDRDFYKDKLHVKNRKKYLFVCPSSSTNGKRISSKDFILKHHKINHLPSEVPNHGVPLLRANRKSLLTLNKFKIFSNDIRKDSFSNDTEDGGENEQQNEENPMSEKDDKWKKYYEDKRKKEILKDLDSSVRKREKRSMNSTPGGGDDSMGEEMGSRDGDKDERRDDRTGEEDGEDSDEYEEDDEDDDDDEDDEDDEGYDSYDTYDAEDTHDFHAHRNTQDKRDIHLEYPYNHEEAQGKNLLFANNRNENAPGKFYDDRNDGPASNPPSINESINNIFSAKRTTKDFPLFFPLNNKPFENSNNKYFDKISSIPPNELINRFFENTSERVKEAVKNIIFNIIGNIQKYTIETSILITYDKIYNFLLQIILTGYMIKNADYRLSLNESLYDQNSIINRKEEDFFNLKKSFYGLFADIHKRSGEETLNASELSEPKNGTQQAPSQDGEVMQKSPNLDEETLISNNLQDHLSNDDLPDQDGNPYSYEEGHQLPSDSASYTSGKNGESDNFPIINTKNYIIFLRKKIKSLEMQLKKLKENKTILNDDLLSYIKSLTDVQLRSLTDNIGPLVLDATKKIVELVIQGMTLNINKNSSNELIYVSGSVLTYICFWQLIIGYTLREMEIRDELSDYLKGN